MGEENTLEQLENEVDVYARNLLHKKIIGLHAWQDKPISVYLTDGNVLDGVLSAVNGAFIIIVQDDVDYRTEDLIMLDQIMRVRYSRILMDEDFDEAESILDKD
jgi:hypothetical protein